MQAPKLDGSCTCHGAIEPRQPKLTMHPFKNPALQIRWAHNNWIRSRLPGFCSPVAQSRERDGLEILEARHKHADHALLILLPTLSWEAPHCNVQVRDDLCQVAGDLGQLHAELCRKEKHNNVQVGAQVQAYFTTRQRQRLKEQSYLYLSITALPAILVRMAAELQRIL